MAMASIASADKWEDYEVGGLNCHSVTGGPENTAADYDKVVILLHGGGQNGMSWKNMIYDSQWLGNITGYKYVFPDGPIEVEDYQIFLWYESIKQDGCGLNSDCGYNVSTIESSAQKVRGLIEYEKEKVGNNAKKVFLGGYSQGG